MRFQFAVNQSFTHHIENLSKQLDIPDSAVAEFVKSGKTNYVDFLKSMGAKLLCYRPWIRKKVGHIGLVLPGGNVVAVTHLPSGEFVALVQHRSDTNNIGFAGGSIDVWSEEINMLWSPLCSRHIGNFSRKSASIWITV